MDSDELEALAARALAALQAGNLDLGLALADQCVRAEPGNPVFRCWRAQAVLLAGNPREAFTEARLAVQFGPDMPAAHAVLGRAAWAVGLDFEAQRAFEMALELSARAPEVLTEYATFMAARRGPRLAAEIALQAVRALPDSADAWQALGLAQFRQHRHAVAESSLRRALELDPDSSLAKAVLADLYTATGRQEKAAALVRLMQDDPGAAPIVESLRRAQREKQTWSKLYDRPEVQEALFGGRRERDGAWPYYAVPIARGLFLLCLIAALSALTGNALFVLGAVAAFALLWWWTRR